MTGCVSSGASLDMVSCHKEGTCVMLTQRAISKSIGRWHQETPSWNCEQHDDELCWYKMTSWDLEVSGTTHPSGWQSTRESAGTHSSANCCHNSMCILGAWTLWKLRNACVFDGVSPNLQQVLHNYKDEFQI